MSTVTADNAIDRPESNRDAAAGTGGDTAQVVSFRLADEEYGLDIMKVQEIILVGEITEIPEVPDYLRGLIDLRGKVIPIVDLRRRFGLEAGTCTEQARIVVVNTGESIFGIVVDAVNEVLRIGSSQIEPPPTGLLGIEQAYIKGLVKMEDKIMILLNIDRVLSKADTSQIQQQSRGASVSN
ncbi:MAG: chemotaxis protein CheW [Phycisphaerae bacterium]